MLKCRTTEYIQWLSCNIAKKFNIPVHFIDRSQMALLKNNDPYFVSLKNEVSYQKIEYCNRKTLSKSLGGRQLTDGQQILSEKCIDIFLTSVLIST